MFDNGIIRHAAIKNNTRPLCRVFLGVEQKMKALNKLESFVTLPGRRGGQERV